MCNDPAHSMGWFVIVSHTSILDNFSFSENPFKTLLLEATVVCKISDRKDEINVMSGNSRIPE